MRHRLALLAAAAAVALAGCGLDDKDDGPGTHDAMEPPRDAFIGDGHPPDAPLGCPQCAADQICVQFFDGVCHTIRIECQVRNQACPENACTADCMQWHCNGGAEPPFFRCDVAGCGGEAQGALHCYGP